MSNYKKEETYIRFYFAPYCMAHLLLALETSNIKDYTITLCDDNLLLSIPKSHLERIVYPPKGKCSDEQSPVALVKPKWSIVYKQKIATEPKQNYYDDFDQARKDFLCLSQDARDNMEWVYLVEVLYQDKSDIHIDVHNALISILEIYNYPPYPLYGCYHEISDAFKSVFGNPVATSKDTPYTNAYAVVKASKLKEIVLCERDYIVEYKPDNTKYAIIFDVGNGEWNFTQLINKDDIDIVPVETAKEEQEACLQKKEDKKS